MQTMINAFQDSMLAANDDRELVLQVLALQSSLPLARKQSGINTSAAAFINPSAAAFINPSAAAFIRATQTYKAQLKTLLCAHEKDVPEGLLEQYRLAQASDDRSTEIRAEIAIARSSPMTHDLFQQMVSAFAAYNPRTMVTRTASSSLPFHQPA